MTRLSSFLAALLMPALAMADVESGANHLWERALYGGKSGITALTLSGYNGGPTTTYEAVSPESAAYSFRSSAMSSPYCASSSTNDTSAGTGARTISVSGVDTSYATFTETVTMNGQTSVNLVTTNVLGINSVTVLTAGSGGSNAGVVRCGTGTNTAGVPAVVEAHVPVGLNQQQSFIYTVPASYTLLCDGLSVANKHTTAANTYDFALDTIVNGVSSGLKVRRQLGYMEAGGGNPAFFPFKIKFAAKTQLQLQVLAATATDPVFANMNCLLISDTWAATAQSLF